MSDSLNETDFFDHSYARLPEVFFEACAPVPVAEPVCVLWNEALAKTLGVEDWAGDAHIWSGNRLPANAQPLAQAYAGHQFGHFTMLGDGRAHLIGERVLKDGSRVDLQFKGSGRTVFSRGGDGRAALEPMLREYLISEAMHALGIPTTRSLAVVRTGERVHRERPLPGAVLTRVAASHLRVGTFQYAAGCGEPDALSALIRYALARHVPGAGDAENPARTLLEFVVAAQAGLIALWNLSRFAETLLTALDPEEAKAIEIAEGILKKFEGLFRGHWLTGMRAKLGLFTEETADEALIGDLLETMQRHRADYTRTFSELDPESPDAFFDASWQHKWLERLSRQPQTVDEVRERMRKANPRVIPRNHLVEAALNAAGEGDMAPFEALLAVLRDPFSPDEIPERYMKGPPEGLAPYVTYCGT